MSYFLSSRQMVRQRGHRARRHAEITWLEAPVLRARKVARLSAWQFARRIPPVVSRNTIVAHGSEHVVFAFGQKHSPKNSLERSRMGVPCFCSNRDRMFDRSLQSISILERGYWGL